MIADWRLRIADCRLILLALAVGCMGCQSVAKPPPQPASETGAAPSGEFLPATFVSGLRMEKGNGADLFAPDSYAVWVGADVTALRRAHVEKSGEKIDPIVDADLARMTENFFILECHLASVFEDSSIAYDVVGLRGMSVYLACPDGRRVSPIQTVTGTMASTEARGALKRFGRTIYVIFPKRGFGTATAAIAADTPSVRLVMEGHESVLYFEWNAAIAPTTPWNPSEDERVKATKIGLKEFYNRLAQLSHMLD